MKILVGALIVLGAAWGSIHSSADDRESSAVLTVKSDRVENLPDHVMKATGNVEAKAVGWRLRADSVVVRRGPENAAAGDAIVGVTAEGNVVFERGDDRIRVKRLQFDPRTGRGTFELEKP
jgi:lipopolysaccharide export system protein LptA